MRSGSRVVRSWPWTIALASVLAGFVLFGLFTLGLRVSTGARLVSLAVTAAALVGLVRTLSTGVSVTPSGLVIRELTRTVRVPWTRVRGVTCRPTGRRRVHAPVLMLAPERAVKGARRGRGADETLEVTVLASYREAVARARADLLARAHAEAR